MNRQYSPYFIRGSLILIIFLMLGTFQNCTSQFRPIGVFSPGQQDSSSSSPDGVGTPITPLPPAPPPPIVSKAVPSSVAKTLSREESLRAVRDLVGAELIPDSLMFVLPSDEQTLGFESVSVRQFDEGYLRNRLEFSEAVAGAALNSTKVMTCQPHQDHRIPWEGCIQGIVTNFAERALGRAPASAELSSWKTSFDSTVHALGSLAYTTTPLGHLDEVYPNLIAAGWSLDPNWSDRPVLIHFYIGEPGKGGTVVGSTFTRYERNDVVEHFAKEGLAYPGKHGFQFQVPVQYANGQPHTLYAYAIGASPDGSVGSNPLIGTKTFTVAQQPAPATMIPGLSASTELGLRTVFTSILMSPAFTFRDPPKLEGEADSAFQNRRMARKLALFLTGSIPDQALIDAAKQGQLLSPAGIQAQASRLLDQNLGQFALNSFGQWFGFRDFSRREGLSALEGAMVTESRLVFEEILRRDLPVESILEPGFSFLNKTLADHYGIGGVSSENFSKVTQMQRGGVLSQGAVLRQTSPGDETKVIQRGKWVLSNLMCETVDLPSNMIREQAIADSIKKIPDNASVKETLAFHRSQGATCYNCHRRMDPIGLSLEIFDSLGRIRSAYPDGKPVEPSGDLDGAGFKDAYELSSLLARRNFKTCATQKLLTYGLGRPIEPFDLGLIADLSTKSTSVKDLVHRIVLSAAFSIESRRNP